MWKSTAILAAVIALYGCSSAPSIKYPSGSANRIAINSSSSSTAAASPAAAVSLSLPAVAPAIAAGGVSGPRPLSLAPERPPAPIALSLFIVNANEQSAMMVMRRWARAARIDFSWETSVDYPVTPAMRQIAARDLPGAIVQMRAALDGVEEPLEIGLGEQGLVVARVAPPPPPPAPVVAPLLLGNRATDPQQPGAQPGETSAPAPAVALTTNPAAPVEPATPPTRVAVEMAPATPKSWSVGAETSLRELLKRWAASEGIDVRWESARDIPITAGARAGIYDGDFRHALTELASKFSSVEMPLGIRFLERGTVLKVYDLAGQS